MVEKEAKDFFREVWAEEPYISMLTEGLEVVVVRLDLQVVVEEAVATLEGTAELIILTPVGEEEDPSILDKISRMNAVTIQMDMVWSP